MSADARQCRVLFVWATGYAGSIFGVDAAPISALFYIAQNFYAGSQKANYIAAYASRRKLGWGTAGNKPKLRVPPHKRMRRVNK